MHDRSDEIRCRVAQAERDELREIGDVMRSDASRLAAWLDAEFPPGRWDDLPDEVAQVAAPSPEAGE